MDRIAQAIRICLHLYRLVWRQARKAAPPLVVLFGAASVAAQIIGAQTGNIVLVFAPVAYAAVLCVGCAVLELPLR
ncbi:hypothetical protein ACH4FX_11955 [Streptomyces sp. NPDC018019]|uniref:hypothetical protein n=1 Tax=Streptomyces sp. NPDC018019 TaxID=3365030 RepID=UPI0037B5E811